MSEEVAPCEHDWRIDTRTVLTSNPPQYRTVCARCGAKGPNHVVRLPVTSNVQTWPKAKP